MERKNPRRRRSTYDDPNQVDDKQLAQLLKARDPSALEVLAHRFGARIETGLIKKFSYISREDIKDILGETILEAFRKGERFSPEISSAITWLSYIAHYQALMFLRKNGLTYYRLDEISEKIAEQDKSQIPEENEEAEQPSIHMEKLLKQLPSRRAEIIRMHYYQGLSITEIADLLDVPVGTIKSDLHRGRNQLRKMLDDED